jgi:phosphatidylinositol-3-phosphatase
MPKIISLEASMAKPWCVRPLGLVAVALVIGACALAVALSSRSAKAQDGNWGDNPWQIRHVFVIAMENHNWTQPQTVAGKIQPIYQNPNAPFINSLVDGTAEVYISGQLVDISKQVAYATAYHNVLATASGDNPDIHPSEPQYIWAEAGTNFGVLQDSDPYTDTATPNVFNTTQHLSGLLQLAGKSWKSYQEDIDLQTDASNNLINLPLPASQWTVPLKSVSGVFDPGNFLNEYNDSMQYNYAPKHNPMVFFTDTNGNGDTTTANHERYHYAPLQQLAFDLNNNQVADYNWITPDQYNEQHSSLTAGFAGLTGDVSSIRSGDNTLSRLVPMIMASDAYKHGGVIILWWDESEADGAGDNQDSFSTTIPEIIISPLAHPNENGVPYASSYNHTHSSDLRTMQEIFHVRASGSSPWIGDAANATDLSDLFKTGVIPSHP